jgi:hypothetical protein
MRVSHATALTFQERSFTERGITERGTSATLELSHRPMTPCTVVTKQHT